MCLGMLNQIYEFRQQCQRSQIKLTSPRTETNENVEKLATHLNDPLVIDKTTLPIDETPSPMDEDSSSTGMSSDEESDTDSFDEDDSSNCDQLELRSERKLDKYHESVSLKRENDASYPCYKCGQYFPLLHLQFHLNVHNSKIYL